MTLFLLGQYLNNCDKDKASFFYILCDINEAIPHLNFPDFFNLAIEHANVTRDENLQLKAFEAITKSRKLPKKIHFPL